MYVTVFFASFYSLLLVTRHYSSVKKQLIAIRCFTTFVKVINHDKEKTL